MNTLDPTFGKTEVLHMLATIKPSLLFCDVEIYDVVKSCLNELGNTAQVFTFGGSKGDSTQVEHLLLETNEEDDFV